MIIYILFIAGFFVLVKGADFLVDGSASIAKKLKVPSIVIGLTIVGFGTSFPELFINIIASIEGNSEIAIGNILGSNIASILLILGISSIIYPIVARKNTVLKEIPFSLLAIILVGVMVNDKIIDSGNFSGITRMDGLILIAFFIIFLYYIFGITRSVHDIPEVEKIKEISNLKATMYIVGGLIGLAIGGKWIVDGAVKIAEIFNISQSLISLTIIAIGTSLPELATSVMAAYKKQSDIAIGGIVGSNIFNIFFILGISAVIRPLPFNVSSNFDITMTIVASIVLFLVLFVSKKRMIKRWQGILMILSYIGYVIFLVLTK
jgi:cation:H+ antiporter